MSLAFPGIPTQIETNLNIVSDSLNSSPLELTVVIPCLNEVLTLEGCIREALDAMAAGDISGEVVVADNGSTDGSQNIALKCGARVVSVTAKGYGYALRGASQ